MLDIIFLYLFLSIFIPAHHRPSSADIYAESIMQSIVREEFKDRTIISAAHRLETIVDFEQSRAQALKDRECDSQQALLKTEGSQVP